jgi:hypothetical protein
MCHPVEQYFSSGLLSQKYSNIAAMQQLFSKGEAGGGQSNAFVP